MVIKLILSLCLTTFYLEGMDRPYPHLDLTSSHIPDTKPPRIMLLTGLDPQEGFDTLIHNKALFLKTLVFREQRGEYCSMLQDAEQILHSAFVYDKNGITSELKKPFIRDVLIRDSETLHFVTCIAHKKHAAEKLAEAMYDIMDESNIARAEAIISSNPYVTNAYMPWGCVYITPLNYLLNRIRVKFISYEMGYKLADLLLKKGANPNATDVDGEGHMSLHYASTSELIELLLSFGAKTNIKNAFSSTPLVHHIKWGYTANNTPLCALIKSLLFTDQSSIHERGYADNTALHYAARKHATDLVQLLLENGANCTLTNAEEETAWHIAKPMNKECLENHLYITICNALKENDTSIIKSIVKTHPPCASMHDTNFSFSMLTYVVRGIPIIEWAKKYCRAKKDNKLFYSVLVLNQELVKQWVDFPQHNADSLLNAISLYMHNPYVKPPFNAIEYAIERKNISKIKMLLDKGVHITVRVLVKIRDLMDDSLTELAENKFKNQFCFKCHATLKEKIELNEVYDLINFESFITCKLCNPYVEMITLH